MKNYGDGLVTFGEWLQDSPWAFDFDVYEGLFVELFEDATQCDYEKRTGRLRPEEAQSLRTALLESYLAGHESYEIVTELREALEIASDAGQLKYLRALVRSTISVYEVVESVPDSHMVLRDLLRGGEPVRVRERSASRTLVRWDLILTRVLKVAGVQQICGGTIPVSREAWPLLQREFKRVLSAERRKIPRESRSLPEFEHAVLSGACEEVGWYTLITWIMQGTPDPRKRPELVNTDREPVEFVSLAYPIKSPRQEILKALHSASDFEADDAESWSWIQDSRGEPVVHAFLHIEGDRLLAECNSGKRGKRLTERLLKLLGAKLGKPLKLRSSVAQEMSLKPPSPKSAMDDLTRRSN